MGACMLACLHENMSYRKTYLTDLSYGKTCLIGVHVLSKDRSYRRIFLTGGLVRVCVCGCM